MLAKKINLLLHLAKIDGHFADSERALLVSILKDFNIEESYIDQHKHEVVDLKGLSQMDDKVGLLYSVLRLIHADGYLHASEAAYAKIVATRLQFDERVITYFDERPIPSWQEFQGIVKAYSLT